MTRKPHPRSFTHAEPFIAARMAHAAAALPQVTPYDSHAEASAKRAALAQAIEDARDEACEEWDEFVENMTEAYERAIGPAWAD